jgi:chromate transporter
LPLHISRFAAVVAFLLFFSLLLALMLSRHLLRPSVFWIRYCEIFFRIGCSTLGGGYVVISMLLVELVDSGLIENYQLIQAFVLSSMMPGPMFTLSAYLGAVMDGFQGAVLCWICLFAPGVLMLFVVLHAWKWMREQKIIKAALPGVNAGAIGLIIASAILLGTVIIGVDHVFWVVAILCYFVHDRCKLDVPYTILLGGVLGLALKEFHSVL